MEIFGTKHLADFKIYAILDVTIVIKNLSIEVKGG